MRWSSAAPIVAKTVSQPDIRFFLQNLPLCVMLSLSPRCAYPRLITPQEYVRIMNNTDTSARRGQRRGIKLSPAQTIAIGFAIIILTGALLLMLPVSNRDGGTIPFINALFTAVSATCITGLSVYDIWSQFSGFGHVVMLVLVQIGGLGFMTMAVMFSFATKKRISLRERTYLSEAVSASQIGGIVRLTRRILAGTAIFELGGALLLSFRFCPQFGFWKGLWYGLFHSITAFCNAGFDLMGCLEPGSSLTLYAGDWWVNVVIMLLVVIGGIGFAVWSDLLDNRWHWKKYSLHTKLILTATAVFVAVPTVVFFFTERTAAMAGMSGSDRLLSSLFQSVTTRTAGFAGVNNGALSPAGRTLTMLLMFVGGAPGSTAGGIKISTFAVVVLAIVCYIRGRADVNCFDRRLDSSLIRRAFCTLMFNLMLAICGIFIISSVQPALPLEDVFFETFSAIGTVGLTAGITGELALVSKAVIILLMYAGRVGSLAVLVTAAEPRSYDKLRNPEGKIIIG